MSPTWRLRVGMFGCSDLRSMNVDECSPLLFQAGESQCDECC